MTPEEIEQWTDSIKQILTKAILKNSLYCTVEYGINRGLDKNYLYHMEHNGSMTIKFNIMGGSHDTYLPPEFLEKIND